MSKNNGRYKEDYRSIGEDELEELDTKNFERIPSNKNKKTPQQRGSKKSDKTELEDQTNL